MLGFTFCLRLSAWIDANEVALGNGVEGKTTKQKEADVKAPTLGNQEVPPPRKAKPPERPKSAPREDSTVRAIKRQK